MYSKGTKLRDQLSSDQDAVSKAAGLACDPSDNKVRPEFGPDTHLPTLLARFPSISPIAPSRFGEQDFSGDLTAAFQADRNAEAIYRDLPQALRDKYPTWRMFWRALTTGEISLEDAEPGSGASSSGARSSGSSEKPGQEPAA